MTTFEFKGKTIEYDEDKFLLVEGTEESVTKIYGTDRAVFIQKGRDFIPPVYIGDYQATEGLVLVTSHVFLLNRKQVAAIEK